MTDRHHGGGGYAPPGRSSTFNSARSSMPSSIGYSSLYAGDMHVMPSSARQQPMTTSRGYTTSTTPNGVPTATRTYAVTQDPHHRPRPTVAAREPGRTRRSTMDSSPRPPVIVTTTQQASHPSNRSPVTTPRASDTQFTTQPASSTRSRGTVPYYHRTHGHSNSEDFSRGRERDRTDAALAARDADAYRSARPSVLYPSDPRHSTAAVDYGDDGYQYTNAGELARYDLDHSRPSRSRRRESLDRGYYRPNISYHTDQRRLNVNTSADLSRNYTMNTSRLYEGPSSRGGPPPSTRGFDRIDRGFESSRDVPPAAPIPPPPTTSRQGEASGGSAEWREARRGRPVSLYQDSAPRSSHHDDYYRSREDERNMRELRDRVRESERTHDAPYFRDDSVTTRGFGIRTGPPDGYDSRHDQRREAFREEPRKQSDEHVAPESEVDHDRRRWNRPEDSEGPRRRSDEETPHESDPDRERTRRSRPDDKEEPHKRSDEDFPAETDAGRERRRRNQPDDREEERRERRESKRETDEERSRLRDKLASGVGVAAAAVGLAPQSKDDDSRERSGRESRRRRSPSEDRERRPNPYLDRPRDDENDHYKDRSKDRGYERDRYEDRPRDLRYERDHYASKGDSELKDREGERDRYEDRPRELRYERDHDTSKDDSELKDREDERDRYEDRPRDLRYERDHYTSKDDFEPKDREGERARYEDGPRDREYERDRYEDRPPKDRKYERDHYSGKNDTDPKERRRGDAEEKTGDEAVSSGSDSDGAKKASRRHRPSNAFDPNDAGDISKLREQLAEHRHRPSNAFDPNDAGDISKLREQLAENRHRPSNAFNPNDASDISKLRGQLAEMETVEKDKEPESKEPVGVETRASQPESPPREPAPLDNNTGESREDELALVRPEERAVRVVSPPRDQRGDRPLKGILKQPSASFPEEENYMREGVAPHREDKKAKGVPAGAKWTKINRKIVNPEALTVGKERFEVRDDFVIVLRVLSKEEIQAYAAATAVLRERRRGRDEDDTEKDEDRDHDDGRRRRRRSRRYRDEDDYETEDQGYERDHDRRRRHRRDKDEDDYDRRPARDSEYPRHHHHHRPHRDGEREAVEA